MQSIFFVNRRTLTRNAEASLTSSIMCWNLLMNGDSELVLALEMLHTACNSRLCSGITWYFWEPLFLMSIVKKGIDIYLNINVVHRMSTAQKHIFVTTLNTVAVFLRSCTFPVRTSKRMSLFILDDINRPVRSSALFCYTPLGCCYFSCFQWCNWFLFLCIVMKNWSCNVCQCCSCFFWIFFFSGEIISNWTRMKEKWVDLGVLWHSRSRSCSCLSHVNFCSWFEVSSFLTCQCTKAGIERKSSKN